MVFENVDSFQRRGQIIRKGETYRGYTFTGKTYLVGTRRKFVFRKQDVEISLTTEQMFGASILK